jgi:hypothetical protein
MLFKNLSEVLIGFGRSKAVNDFYEYTQAMDQGASPNTFMTQLGKIQILSVSGANLAELIHAMRWTRTSWLVTPFMMMIPLLIHGWPRDDSPNPYLNNIKAFLRGVSNINDQPERSWRRRLLGKGLRGLHFVLDSIPIIRRPLTKKILRKLDQFILPISLGLTLVAYVGLFYYGFTVLAAVGGVTLGFGLLDRLNVVPLFIRNAVKKWGILASVIGGLVAGSPIECIISLASLFILYGHYLQYPFKQLLSYFPQIPRLAGLSHHQEQEKRFDFECQADQFFDSLNAMHDMQEDCTIIRSHVLDNSSLLPPSRSDVNLDDLVTLFDSVDWENEKHTVVEQNKHLDWQLLRDKAQGEREGAAPQLCSNEQYSQDILYLRNNLTKFIDRIRNNDIHAVKHGAEGLVLRYTQNIVAILTRLQRSLNDSKQSESEGVRIKNTLLDTLIRLGYDTGDYCGTGLLRTTESNYRSLITDQKLNLKDRIRFIHQMHRESYFQKCYLKDKLYYRDDERDTHAYARAVLIHAPKLGLPCEFAYNDELNDYASPLMQDFFSSVSKVEKEFWTTHISIVELKRQIRNEINTPLIRLEELHEWYNQFIDEHVIGSEEEKEALKEEYPYTLEIIDGIPFYRLKENILHLMLLDFGVIALPGNNSFRLIPRQNVLPASPTIAPAFGLAANQPVPDAMEAGLGSPRPSVRFN